MQYGIWRALPLFLLGMGLAAFTEKVWVAPRLAGWIGIGAALAFAVVQYFDKHALVSLVLISLIILAAGAIPVTRPSAWITRASIVSFSMFITNEVVRIAWFGVANVAIARFALSVPIQWGLWVGGVAAAFVFAFVFQATIDGPMQGWIKRRLKRRRPTEAVVAQPVVSLEG